MLSVGLEPATCEQARIAYARPMQEDAGEPYADLDVIGRPATFATAHEAAWKAAVREAVERSRVSPRPDARFRVQIEFRTPEPTTTNHRWDLDNLVKPTLDAMEGIFGLRDWRGVPQPNDDLVVQLVASKRTISASELAGAHIAVWLAD
jgi:Holliday junction resolvase RusA-like endonuclease